MFTYNEIVKYYLYLLSASPLIAYILEINFAQDYRKFFGFFGIMLALGLILIKGIKNIKIHKYLFLLILLYLYYIGWEIIIGGGVIERKGLVYDFFFANKYLAVLAILLVIDNSTFDDGFMKNIVNIFKITILIGGIFMLYQLIVDPLFFTPEKFIRWMNSNRWAQNIYQVKRLSVFGYCGIHDLGLSFIPILAIVIGYITKVKKRIPFFLLIVGIIIAFGSNVRYIQAAYFLCLMPLLFINNKILKNVFIGLGLLIALLFITTIIMKLLGYDINKYISDRILDESALSRILALKIFLRFFPENPFFGTGVHLTDDVVVAIGGRSSQIHVGYLAHLFSYGIIGSIFLFGLWGGITYRFYKIARKTLYFGSFFAFITFLWANVTLVYYSIFTYGIIFSFVFNKYYEDKYSKSETQE